MIQMVDPFYGVAGFQFARTSWAAGIAVLALVLPCSAGDVLTAQQAAGLGPSPQVVTVRMVVESCHPVLPDGKHFRLVSESSFRDEGAFVVHLSEEVVNQFGGRDLNRWFRGKTIRVTGKVEPIVFNSFAETRPGIRVVDAKKLELEISEAVPKDGLRKLQPPLFGSAQVDPEMVEAWREQGIDWELEITVLMHQFEPILSVDPEQLREVTRLIPSLQSRRFVMRRLAEGNATSPLIVNRLGQPLSRQEVRERFEKPQPIFIAFDGALPADWFRQVMQPEAMILIAELSF
jgi:hypothetical protein